MWIAPKYNKAVEFNRQGVCNKVIYDIRGDYETKVDGVNKEIRIGSNSNNIVIVDEIGIREEVECVGFFLNDGMCISIEKGNLYFSSRHNKTFSICSDGFMDLERKDDIVWVKTSTIYEYIQKLIEVRFKITGAKDIQDYASNLMYRFKMVSKEQESDNADNSLVSFRVLKYYTALCLDEFKVVETTEKDDEVSLTYDIDLDSFEELMQEI